MNTKKIALLVLYNHRYDKNIPKIEEIYKNRFTHIFHLMPFYEGEQPNVIPVYESSFQFQSYIAQAFSWLKNVNRGYTHYFIIADDVLLNLSITELNLFEKLGINENDCFITSIREIHKETKLGYIFPTTYKGKKSGVEIENILPNRKRAEEIFDLHKLKTSPLKLGLALKFTQITLLNAIRHPSIISLTKFLKLLLFTCGSRKLKYPLVWGYSDLAIITDDVMPTFATYCGTFAATDLFVEFAIPTAMVLSAKKEIMTDKHTNLKGMILGNGRMKFTFNDKYNYSLEKLYNNFPENTFFVHPIKLSEWKY
jgi:hypothetical protein